MCAMAPVIVKLVFFTLSTSISVDCSEKDRVASTSKHTSLSTELLADSFNHSLPTNSY